LRPDRRRHGERENDATRNGAETHGGHGTRAGPRASPFQRRKRRFRARKRCGNGPPFCADMGCRTWPVGAPQASHRRSSAVQVDRIPVGAPPCPSGVAWGKAVRAPRMGSAVSSVLLLTARLNFPNHALPGYHHERAQIGRRSARHWVGHGCRPRLRRALRSPLLSCRPRRLHRRAPPAGRHPDLRVAHGPERRPQEEDGPPAARRRGDRRHARRARRLHRRQLDAGGGREDRPRGLARAARPRGTEGAPRRDRGAPRLLRRPREGARLPGDDRGPVLQGPDRRQARHPEQEADPSSRTARRSISRARSTSSRRRTTRSKKGRSISSSSWCRRA
jgi:hypothetical protein